jgi:uncharacterized membrane protein YeaQ/YmgE (transglycosylase-associated protein family)
MGILTWVIFGALAGWVASMLVKTNDQQGAIGNIIVGILGAGLGGFLAGLLFDSPGVTEFNFSSFIIAVAGSVLLLIIKGAITGKKAV